MKLKELRSVIRAIVSESMVGSSMDTSNDLDLFALSDLDLPSLEALGARGYAVEAGDIEDPSAPTLGMDQLIAAVQGGRMLDDFDGIAYHPKHWAPSSVEDEDLGYYESSFKALTRTAKRYARDQ